LPPKEPAHITEITIPEARRVPPTIKIRYPRGICLYMIWPFINGIT
jgi:hypothetical protein